MFTDDALLYNEYNIDTIRQFASGHLDVNKRFTPKQPIYESAITETTVPKKLADFLLQPRRRQPVGGNKDQQNPPTVVRQSGFSVV